MSKKPLNLQELSDVDIIKSFYLSQGLLLIIGLVGYFLFYENLPKLLILFTFDQSMSPFMIIGLGMGSGVVIAILELVIDRLVPESWFDDGGINRRIFQAFSRIHVFFAMLVVAIIEEWLFRGIIQTQFGLVIASLLFGFVHIRYIKKPLMLLVALGLGFYLGWLYIYTGGLIAPILAHFTIDTILGFVIKRKIENENIYTL